MEISDDLGTYLVKSARKAVEEVVLTGNHLALSDGVPDGLRFDAGTFVTLMHDNGSTHSLRGCFGMPLPEMPLMSSLLESATSAATSDPRFHPVEPEELPLITVEVSVLSPPEILDGKNPLVMPQKVKVGTHGLIVRWAFGSGLLLPQVALEERWDGREFLSQTCIKAGAPPDLWLLPTSKVYTFEAIVFEELQPRGRIARRRMV